MTSSWLWNARSCFRLRWAEPVAHKSRSQSESGPVKSMMSSACRTRDWEALIGFTAAEDWPTSWWCRMEVGWVHFESFRRSRIPDRWLTCGKVLGPGEELIGCKSLTDGPVRGGRDSEGCIACLGNDRGIEARSPGEYGTTLGGRYCLGTQTDMLASVVSALPDSWVKPELGRTLNNAMKFSGLNWIRAQILDCRARFLNSILVAVANVDGVPKRCRFGS